MFSSIMGTLLAVKYLGNSAATSVCVRCASLRMEARRAPKLLYVIFPDRPTGRNWDILVCTSAALGLACDCCMVIPALCILTICREKDIPFSEYPTGVYAIAYTISCLCVHQNTGQQTSGSQTDRFFSFTGFILVVFYQNGSPLSATLTSRLRGTHACTHLA